MSPDEPTAAYRTDDYTHEAPDGTDLAVRIFRPAEADAPFPTLLQRTPYGHPATPDGHGVAVRALDAGYAVAYEDTRGRGDSEGAFEPWMHEAADGAATVEWLADQPWSTGQVGMYGGSSPGQVQVLAACERPDGLAAIAPMFAPSDLHRADFFQDGAMNAQATLTWSFDAIAADTVDRLHASGRLDDATADAAREAIDEATADLLETATTRPLIDLPARVFTDVSLPPDVAPTDLVPHWESWLSHPTYDDFWRSFDPEPDYDRIDVPGLHVTGWYELCQQGTLTNYRGLRDRSSAPQHLIVGPWTHGNTSSEVGELAFGSEASADAYGLWETHLAFFDTYVRDRPRPPFDEGRLVETFRTERNGGAWERHTDWPPVDAERERWFLRSSGTAATEGGRLARERPTKFEPADRWTHDPTDPVPTRGGPLCCGDVDAGPYDRRAVDRRDDVCTYTTSPLAERVTLAGPVRTDLVLATDAPDTDVVATLGHVSSEGVYPLASGIRRARYRRGRDREMPSTDGPMRLAVNMWDTHYRVPAGDRLRLSVASSDAPRFDPHPGTARPWEAAADEVRTAEQALHHAFDRESTLIVTRR
ncbi:CocE/NonD family hydrolase [Haloplanus aerogenes]|uniref:CocE/NonD family hydrolase n=1 Tax=Haloplanus aerogenes TaxID=660522 RepID=A0A3G8QXJ4_9EURY|nr:CocE/NonD family hydrolase [Haloplanus aerogenes]AZH26985.1 CocE/NonD family hydrolase [Haloplanus aerogenes]